MSRQKGRETVDPPTKILEPTEKFTSHRHPTIQPETVKRLAASLQLDFSDEKATAVARSMAWNEPWFPGEANDPLERGRLNGDPLCEFLKPKLERCHAIIQEKRSALGSRLDELQDEESLLQQDIDELRSGLMRRLTERISVLLAPGLWWIGRNVFFLEPGDCARWLGVLLFGVNQDESDAENGQPLSKDSVSVHLLAVLPDNAPLASRPMAELLRLTSVDELLPDLRILEDVVAAVSQKGRERTSDGWSLSGRDLSSDDESSHAVCYLEHNIPAGVTKKLSWSIVLPSGFVRALAARLAADLLGNRCRCWEHNERLGRQSDDPVLRAMAKAQLDGADTDAERAQEALAEMAKTALVQFGELHDALQVARAEYRQATTAGEKSATKEKWEQAQTQLDKFCRFVAWPTGLKIDIPGVIEEAKDLPLQMDLGYREWAANCHQNHSLENWDPSSSLSEFLCQAIWGQPYPLAKAMTKVAALQNGMALPAITYSGDEQTETIYDAPRECEAAEDDEVHGWPEDRSSRPSRTRRKKRPSRQGGARLIHGKQQTGGLWLQVCWIAVCQQVIGYRQVRDQGRMTQKPAYCNKWLDGQNRHPPHTDDDREKTVLCSGQPNDQAKPTLAYTPQLKLVVNGSRQERVLHRCLCSECNLEREVEGKAPEYPMYFRPAAGGRGRPATDSGGVTGNECPRCGKSAEWKSGKTAWMPRQADVNATSRTEGSASGGETLDDSVLIIIGCLKTFCRRLKDSDQLRSSKKSLLSQALQQDLNRASRERLRMKDFGSPAEREDLKDAFREEAGAFARDNGLSAQQREQLDGLLRLQLDQMLPPPEGRTIREGESNDFD